MRDAYLSSVEAFEVAPVPITWLWPGRIAEGFLNLVAGPAGTGKSTTLYDLAARVSREGRNTLIATAEDHLAAVVRPRLEAADAERGHIFLVTDELTLPEDIDRLETRARELDAVLVTIDPLVAFLNGGIDSHRDASVRQALRPLAAMAERLAAAVVTVVHTNKSASDDPLFRISGSGGFSAAARHVLLACPDPDDETGTRRVLAVVKSNISEFPPPLAYAIEPAAVIDGDGQIIRTSRIRWLEELPGLDPRSLLAQPDREQRGTEAEAAAFLRDALAEGPRPASEILREAAAAGISTAKGTLHRARRTLGITTRKDGLSGGWVWVLTERSTEGSALVPGTLEPSGPPEETRGDEPKVPGSKDIARTRESDRTDVRVGQSGRRGSRDDVVRALQDAGLGTEPAAVHARRRAESRTGGVW